MFYWRKVSARISYRKVYKLIELGKYENYYLITPNNWNEHLEKINKI